jgi:hypothetical protein
VALAVLFPVFGSNWSACEMDAVFVCALGETTLATTRSVSAVPVLTVPTVHTPLIRTYLPRLGLADTNVSPAGSRSVTWTFVAASGPLFESVTVNVIVSPTFGVASLTFFASARSACCGAAVEPSLLLPELGSAWSACAIDAVFVYALGETTVAVICSVCGALVVTVPTVHTPVAEL